MDKYESFKKINKLISYLDNEINYNTKTAAKTSLLVKLATSLGLTIDELLNIKVSKIGDSFLTIERRNGRIDKIEIDDNLYSLLNVYVENYDLQEHDYLFKGRNEKMTEGALHKTFRNYSKKINEKITYQDLKYHYQYIIEHKNIEKDRDNDKSNKEIVEQINILLFKYMRDNDISDELRNTILYLKQLLIVEQYKKINK